MQVPQKASVLSSHISASVIYRTPLPICAATVVHCRLIALIRLVKRIELVSFFLAESPLISFDVWRGRHYDEHGPNNADVGSADSPLLFGTRR